MYRWLASLCADSNRADVERLSQKSFFEVVWISRLIVTQFAMRSVIPAQEHVDKPPIPLCRVLIPRQRNSDLTRKCMLDRGGNSHKSADTDLQDMPQPSTGPFSTGPKAGIQGSEWQLSVHMHLADLILPSAAGGLSMGVKA